MQSWKYWLLMWLNVVLKRFFALLFKLDGWFFLNVTLVRLHSWILFCFLCCAINTGWFFLYPIIDSLQTYWLFPRTPMSLMQTELYRTLTHCWPFSGKLCAYWTRGLFPAVNKYFDHVEMFDSFYCSQNTRSFSTGVFSSIFLLSTPQVFMFYLLLP